ncbi:MAG: hypothetical protein A2Y97_08180 [Nitrospirae bacterium RBG_13_39_12]|nr:MAG: hypothetical protein A2Y97_08180 [Nitrospirae bacterium RBG_13_39_12]
MFKVIPIYCDEDVDILIKPLLEAKGFKVLTTLDEKMLKASDIQQIEYAIKKRYIFLTHNRAHFEELYTELIAKSIDHPGVIIATRRNVYELARRVSKVLSGYTQENIKNKLLYV